MDGHVWASAGSVIDQDLHCARILPDDQLDQDDQAVDEYEGNCTLTPCVSVVCGPSQLGLCGWDVAHFNMHITKKNGCTPKL